MNDQQHLPGQFHGDVQVFNRPSTVTNTQWQTWLKPRGRSMCNILCIGGGGGGGGGFTATTGSAKGGGGSGGSSGVARVTMPLSLLPDRLYVQVGAGGIGVGSGGGTAGSGVLSYVAVHPDITANNVLTISGAAGSVGGGTGTGAAAGGAGVASTIAVIGSMPFAGLGQFDLIAGQAGVTGGAPGANGSAITIPTTSAVCMGGTGGGGPSGADRSGGAFTATANTLISESRPATPAAGSNNGSGGTMLWQPFFCFGGGGGSGSDAGIGGLGGNGAYGAGGGGGGGGTTGGKGGDGGSGIVIITCW